jgi:hypothetical protein
MVVASGLWWPVQLAFARRKFEAAAVGLTCLILGSLLYWNARRYFETYIDNLPDHNTPIGYRIANYTNSLSSDTQVYVVGGCVQVDYSPIDIGSVGDLFDGDRNGLIRGEPTRRWWCCISTRRASCGRSTWTWEAWRISA